MRFSQYKGILEILDSIIEAIEYMRDSNTLQLCDVCVESLYCVLRHIKSEYKSMKLIVLINNALKMLESKSIDYEIINLLLYEIRERINIDIKYKVKVLFIAELGGKWDSLDSVYRACVLRNDCEVDVVLAPIFRAIELEDGTVRQDIIYEDYLSDYGINHIPYNEYDFEKKKPDIIFFSQPYESVTLEMFWPSNLSKYGRLVYVPYYSSTTIKDSITHDYYTLFKSDTEHLSWKIACQSQKMKEHYENNGSIKGRNCVVSGIPKWDYPLKLNKLNTPCPEKWKDKIKDRKVFLWNTHFVSENQGFEIFTDGIKLINYILNNKKIALIWRPHPMTATCLKVYSPETYKLYCELVEKLNESENIMIDDHVLYDYSFVWSDALLSDYSSLIDQFIMMDKPYALLTNKSVQETLEYFKSDDELFDYSNIYIIESIEKVKEFIENISNNIDVSKEKRKIIKDNFFALADGQSGERFVSNILRSLKSELLYIPDTVDDCAANKKTNTEILILGSNDESKACINQLKNRGINYIICNIFENYDFIQEDFARYCELHDLERIDAELYIITSKCFSEEILNILINEYGINKRKILEFWKIYNSKLPFMVCDRIMLNNTIEEYNGIILGISHAEVGIVADKLKEKFCNLSVSSQDLFFQLKTLEYVKDRYFSKIKKIKYAVIDLYDYEYFNYDTSLSKSAIKYLSYGGYNLHSHHFDDNKSFDLSFKDVMSYLYSCHNNGVSEHSSMIWDALFNKTEKYCDYEGFEPNFSNLRNRFRIVTDEDIESFDYDSKVSTKIFSNTISENIENLKGIFNLLLSINPNIKIYTIIIPKYIETANKQFQYTRKHMNYFNEIIDDLHELYKFEHLDFNELSNISEHRSYYFDAAHLNYIGALKLTDMLNKIIFPNN